MNFYPQVVIINGDYDLKAIGGVGKMKRILACDDSAFVRKLVKRELESSYQVELFSDGMEAYEALKQDGNYDLAIIDGEMPRMTGWELVKRIREELKFDDLPVVMLTATDSDYFEHKADEYGAFDYLKKPFKEGELYAYVTQFFKGDLNRGVVLVVEDSRLQNKTICNQLRLKHIKPISTYSGEEALKILLEGADVDTILMDINLPGASGFEVTRALKEDERFNWIPILGITSSSGEEKIEMMKRAFASGVDDFISKPYSVIELYARINANIKRAKLTKTLKQESELDYLTKLYNRRMLFKILNQLYQSALRYDYPLSFVMLDIDHFKKVNDTYGHPAGDDVLVEVAELIRKHVRKADAVARFGGEEFCIVMPHTDLEGACRVAFKIKDTINGHEFVVDAHRIRITISAGATALKGSNDTVDDLIKRADRALYAAKHQGRDRVVCDSKGSN